MTKTQSPAIEALNLRYFLDYPSDAAHRIETMDPAEVAGIVAGQPVLAIRPVLERMTRDAAALLLIRLPDQMIGALLSDLAPHHAVAILEALDESEQARCLGLVDEYVARDLRRQMEYPADSAGRLMDTRIGHFRAKMTVATAVERLHQIKARTVHNLFLVDDEGGLTGRVPIQSVVLAGPDETLGALSVPVEARVEATAPSEDAAAMLDRYRLAELPAVDFAGRLLGIIGYTALVDALEQEATADIQTMVGASREERALSPAMFAVKKRLPWLEINLLTAFLAASVVGLFESTIAKFTALAVLLPVVAGQSGNAGAQALAVTLRGLALREIAVRSWRPVIVKEIAAGFLNGLAIAVTCALGVLIWSGSWGLSLVIASSMILSMIVAGFAGALVPIALTAVGQDPAQSSSIVLTTVTDVAGFFSFLGIATLLAVLL